MQVPPAQRQPGGTVDRLPSQPCDAGHAKPSRHGPARRHGWALCASATPAWSRGAHSWPGQHLNPHPGPGPPSVGSPERPEHKRERRWHHRPAGGWPDQEAAAQRSAQQAPKAADQVGADGIGARADNRLTSRRTAAPEIAPVARSPRQSAALRRDAAGAGPAAPGVRSGAMNWPAPASARRTLQAHPTGCPAQGPGNRLLLLLLEGGAEIHRGQG